MTDINQDGKIDWRELSRALMRQWKVVAIFFLLATIVSATYAHLAPDYYKADTLIAPAEDNEKSNALSALGSVASLTGLSIKDDTNKGVALAMLQSRTIIEGMIRDRDLLPVLYSNIWDPQSRKWKESDPKKIPTPLDGYDLFVKRIVNIDEDKKTGLVKIEVEWKSPQLAYDWANEIVARTNDELRNRALVKSENDLAYLQDQVQKSTVVEMREAIYHLMEDELKKAMLAKGNREYAFKVVDPAVIPEKKSWPRRTLIVLLGAMAGLMLGIGAALLNLDMSKDPK
jgi:uncharacterized protein involved in exopolysaccharide biosynthesis